MIFNIPDILPTPGAVLESQGMPRNLEAPKHIGNLASSAVEIFSNLAAPEGLTQECAKEQFEQIFQGEKKNAYPNPLQDVFPKANRLALFALTMGSAVSLKIHDLFENNDFALGALLDSVASLAADRAVDLLENTFLNEPGEDNLTGHELSVLGYSPGYCGWDISGQGKLFEFLQPERIGITLNRSFLMTPLKSVTGVLVAGRRDIHVFKANFGFCGDCQDPACQVRMRKALKTGAS